MDRSKSERVVRYSKPEDPTEPTLVSAKFTEQELLKHFGFVTVEVKNIEGAAKFSVGYKTSGATEYAYTNTVALNEAAGMIFYDKAQNKFVEIKVYDEAGTLLHTFENVELTVVE